MLIIKLKVLVSLCMAFYYVLRICYQNRLRTPMQVRGREKGGREKGAREWNKQGRRKRGPYRGWKPCPKRENGGPQSPKWLVLPGRERGRRGRGKGPLRRRGNPKKKFSLWLSCSEALGRGEGVRRGTFACPEYSLIIQGKKGERNEGPLLSDLS